MRQDRPNHGLLAATLAVALASQSTFAAAAPSWTSESAADQALYAARYEALMRAPPDTYAPLEAMPGAARPKALPLARRASIAPAALVASRAYAEANRSRAFLVWRGGAIEEADYFQGAGPATPLISRSLSKPLTAIVVGRAIQLDFIASLDQPVSDFITEWRGGPKAAITVRELLDMRSGLLAQGPAPSPDDVLNHAYLDPRHDAVLIDDYPFTHAPGQRFDYANAVSDLVAIVIERATHERYARFVSEAVLKPLGAPGGQIWVDRPGGLAHSACCALLPAESWLRLAILLIDDGSWSGRRLLPRGYVEAMRTGTPQNPNYGLGVYLGEPYALRRGFGNPDTPGPRVLQGEPYLAQDLILFDGNADQVVYIIPSQRLIILRMGDPPPKSPEWDNAVLPNTILRGLTPP